MLKWMGERVGFGGEPDRDEDDTVARVEGDRVVVLELQVVDDQDAEADGWRATTR